MCIMRHSHLPNERIDCMDSINPPHYAVGGIQTIDYMKAKLTPEQYCGYLLGNIIKYTSRFQHKNGTEDLLKAQWYLATLIKEMQDA